MTGPVAGVVLAAGLSRRMGRRNKLVLEVDGEPMVRRVAGTALAAGLDPVVVVGAEGAPELAQALGGLPVRLVANRRPEEGLSSSLRVGLDCLPAEVAGAVVLLGDMPWVRPEHVRSLLAAFDPASGREVCVPTSGGRRGNPVLWGARFFGEMRALLGDAGAKSLMERHADALREVPVEGDGVLRDVDTPEELQPKAGAERPHSSASSEPCPR